tara:strand:+ start:9055 stop:10578 length:1524 start_codon:yes stop_codon:yes gene_type:complete
MMENSFLSLLPPIIAILLAILSKRVLLSLLAGVFLGSVIVNGLSITALFESFDNFVVPTLSNNDNVKVLLFTMFLGGVVSVIVNTGFAQMLINSITKHNQTKSSIQIKTWLAGMVVFFDDYANALLVGTTMRGISDQYKISREKLAYIVDSTSAPIASIALISSWIGFEVGLIQDSIDSLGIEANGYSLFIESLPYRFYPILALIFVFFIAKTGLDYGPMLEAEKRALDGNFEKATTQNGGDDKSGWLAFVPIITIILVTLWGLWKTGLSESGQSIASILSQGDPFTALFWASIAGSFVAIVMAACKSIFNISKIMDFWIKGLKSMLHACCILVLAWSLKDVCDQLGTASYLISQIDSGINIAILPMVIFVLAAVVSFSTGTSFGTMGILMPIVIPLSVSLLDASNGFSASSPIFLCTVSAVLAGSVWGDHCSPISDTTILSSTAAGSDHIEHVKTQMPYAVFVAVIAIVFGYLPVALGLSPWISLSLASLSMWLFLNKFGQKAKLS